ncbi:transcriptional regulator Kaiso [Osmerus eperlanus]|uniref:transcriptional regulator Kaiso n=1 Tax=Osmerus eperlanus TaxID=29151 RepID=UPI002E0E784A
MASLKLISATDTQYSATVLKSMNEQRNHGLFCDVTIIIQDRKFRAHKTILSASSTYFHQLFSVAGQVIELNFIRADIFEEILNFIYSSKIVRVRSDILEELISAGQTLGVKFIANLGVPLSQVKGLPGLSKDTENSTDRHDDGLMMPIITESFSLSAEEFNQTDKSTDKEQDSDSDEVLFVSKTDAQTRAIEKSKHSEIIDLDAPDSEEESVTKKKCEAIPAITKEQQKTVKAGPTDGDKLSLLHSPPSSLKSHSPMMSPDTSSSIPPLPGGSSSDGPTSGGTSPATPQPIRISFTPELHNTSLPSENHEVLGVHKKQVVTPRQGDFKIRLSDVKSPGHTINEVGVNISKSVMAAKKTITLDKASEIDSLSTGCKVYANIGENTYDIVPMKEDPGEGGSKGSKGKRAVMSTALKTFDTSPLSPQGGPTKKRTKTEQEDHYELIMDGKTFFVCVVCKRPYVCLTSLRRHFNTHSWEKKYPCHYCDKVFALAEYRTKHEIHHTGERRYQCLLCNDMFMNYQLLSTHCKQAHNQDPSGRKEKDDTNNNLYRLLPCKTLQLKPYSYVSEDPDGIPVINEDGVVHHINPNRGQLADQGLQSSTQGKMLNWDDIFVEPGAHSRPGAHPRPASHTNPPQPPPPPPSGSSEFEFVIPETY